MAEVKIRTLKDGPYEVRGGVDVVDASRNPVATQGDPIYLCRCGASKTKPFCDGNHKQIGFKSEPSGV